MGKGKGDPEWDAEKQALATVSFVQGVGHCLTQATLLCTTMFETVFGYHTVQWRSRLPQSLWNKEGCPRSRPWLLDPAGFIGKCL